MIRILLTAMTLILLVQSHAFSQSEDVPKFEVAAEFTSLTRGPRGDTTDPGLGGRVTYNINRHFSVEGAGYFFPRRCLGCNNNGRMSSVLGGVKAGKRFENWGVFVKARPGIVSFSEGQFDVVQTGDSGPFPFVFQRKRLTTFAMDVGPVLEFYPSKRVVTRFDAADTLFRFGRRRINGIGFDPSTGMFDLFPFTVPARTIHNFQFTASVGFRF